MFEKWLHLLISVDRNHLALSVKRVALVPLFVVETSGLEIDFGRILDIATLFLRGLVSLEIIKETVLLLLNSVINTHKNSLCVREAASNRRIPNSIDWNCLLVDGNNIVHINLLDFLFLDGIYNAHPKLSMVIVG